MFRDSGHHFHRRSSSNDKMEQMTKQQQLIEQKKLEIQMKVAEKKRQETEEALKKIKPTAASINKNDSLLNSKNRWRKSFRSPNVVENTATGLKNIFSNDGSFLEQFKKISGIAEDQNAEDGANSEIKGRSDGDLGTEKSDSAEIDRLEGDKSETTAKSAQQERDYNRRPDRNFGYNHSNSNRFGSQQQFNIGTSSVVVPPVAQPLFTQPPPGFPPATNQLLPNLFPPPPLQQQQQGMMMMNRNTGFPNGGQQPPVNFPPGMPIAPVPPPQYPPPQFPQTSIPPPPPLPSFFPPPGIIPPPAPINPLSIPSPSPLLPCSIPSPSPLQPSSIPPPRPLMPHAIPPPSPLTTCDIPPPPKPIPPPPQPPSGFMLQATHVTRNGSDIPMPIPPPTPVPPPPAIGKSLASVQSSVDGKKSAPNVGSANVPALQPTGIPVPAEQKDVKLTDDLNPKQRRSQLISRSSPSNEDSRDRLSRSPDSSRSQLVSRSDSSSSSSGSDDERGVRSRRRRHRASHRPGSRQSPGSDSDSRGGESDERSRGGREREDSDREDSELRGGLRFEENAEEEDRRQLVKEEKGCGDYNSFKMEPKHEVKQEELSSDLDGVPLPVEKHEPIEKPEYPSFLFSSEIKKEASDNEEDSAKTVGTQEARRRKRRSRWGQVAASDAAGAASSALPMTTPEMLAAIPTPAMPPVGIVIPTGLGMPIPAPQVPTINVPGMKGAMISQVSRTDPALLQYAMQNFGSTQLSEEDWKKAEDHFKINLLYQDMLKKRDELQRLQAAGKNKYEYDSDEETEGGTWEHRLREKEMEATQLWAEELTEAAKGKHHIGDFLPPEELSQFMEKYEALKQGRPPDLSDYKEYKLKEDNIGFQMLQKLGWTEGQGLGSDGTGILDPVNKATARGDNQGLGLERPDDVSVGDDEYDAYRKRMMLAYRFRPNPLNNPRRPYY